MTSVFWFCNSKKTESLSQLYALRRRFYLVESMQAEGTNLEFFNPWPSIPFSAKYFCGLWGSQVQMITLLVSLLDFLAH